jgi:hypothetical protein
MPPKDPVVAPLIAAHDRIDFPKTTTASSTTTITSTIVVSPTSTPTSSFAFQHAITTNEDPTQQQHLPATTAKPFLLLEQAATQTSSTTSSLGQQHPLSQQQLPTTISLLPRPEQTSTENESTKIPVFLAFLNKLHGGALQQQQQHEPFNLLGSNTVPVVTTSTFNNVHSKAMIRNDLQRPPPKRNKQPKVVQFAPPPQLQMVHPVLSRHDMTSTEIQNTWYTEHCLRMKGQVQQEPENDDQDDDDYVYKFRHDNATTSSSSSSMMNHKRDKVLAGMYIRRARKIVLTEQSRQDYYSLHNDHEINYNDSNNSKEERIRGAYHKVTLYCSREAKARGEAAAKLAAKLT